MHSQSDLYILHPGWGFEDEMSHEFSAIDRWFDHGYLIEEIPDECTVVLPRFRALPFGRELAEEMTHTGRQLLNSFSQHRWCADLGAWYPAFKGLTPRSWSRIEDIPIDVRGPFVVKGETNSRRQMWKTHCYAKDRSSIGQVIGNLLSDSLIQHQTLWIREYVPLASYFTDVVGMPVSDEYRIFFLDGRELARGFYWANHLEDIRDMGESPDPRLIPDTLVREIGRRLSQSNRARFVAVDVARTAQGEWIVIEVNDGQMAGCCGVNSEELYKGLFERFSR